jgi:sugar phosphate isomerase/epimerase
MNMTRRQFQKSVTLAAASTIVGKNARATNSNSLRLGGPVFGTFKDPNDWAKAHIDIGYRAAYCPVKYNDPEVLKQAYVKAAADVDIVISEVGAWSNPISTNDSERRTAIQKNVNSLALADEIGAMCCVNIAGSRGASWAGPHEDNLRADTFDLIVETVRKIIDEVKPKRAFYTLETMPYTIPDSPESYLKLIKTIDRPQFGCHLDPVNMISSPRRYFYNGQLLKESFDLLGPYIKSCHAKDIILRDKLTVHLDEIRPGLGRLDYAMFLHELSKLPGSIGLMMEHLKTDNEYQRAGAYIRSVAEKESVSIL